MSLDIAAAKKRCEMATPEPWMRNGQTVQGLWRIDGNTERVGFDFMVNPVALIPNDADADFIEAARSDLPAALEALEEAQAHLKTVRWVLEMDDPRLLKALQTIERLLKERDGYAAQSKRRGEALEKVVSRWQSYRSETLPGRTRNQDLGYCAEDMKEIARDAIAISPEQAREKERE